METKLVDKYVNWTRVKNECRSTVGKDATDNEPSETFKENLIICEHSPIRCLKFTIRWKDLKSWVSVHLCRHHIGVEKWVQTQRTDRTGVNRDEAPQGTLIDMDYEFNAQAAINISRVRLCYQASPETRQAWEEVKKVLKDDCNDSAIVSNAMVPNCIYRAGCPEINGCKFYEHFLEWCYEQGVEPEDLFDIKTRYDLYNRYFYHEK